MSSENSTKVHLDGVMETLLIPLLARANETKQNNPRIIDNKAVEMVDRLDYDFSKFSTGHLSKEGIISRTIIIDRETKKYINLHPNCTVFSIGCGLDTRFSRVDNGKIHWYDVDFPDVIDLRKKFFQENERWKMISKSCTDNTWPNGLSDINDDVLIIFEGILMYLRKEEVQETFEIIRRNFNNPYIIAELMCEFPAKHSDHHDTVSKTNAEFHFGIDYGKDMDKIVPGLQCDDDISLSTEMGFFLGLITRPFNDHIALLHF